MADIDFGDAPAWVAAGLAGGAFVIAALARRDSKKSAQAAVEAVVEAKRASDAGVRSAVAAEGSLALQRQEAAARQAAEAEAARPRASLALHWQGGQVFQLVNEGTASAENLRLLTQSEDVEPMDPFSLLDPGEVARFMIMTGLGSEAPASLEFTWDGQDRPVRLRVPRTG
ncbi:hypothetical protein PUR59_04275 [Streptomyces sp. SP18ES09]|uniref:hypothetical protein n=1 Tax=Streptomyces sp. SP18ES09 TaxID=3002532 RepID=UPI002E78F7E2|nr:hypothetical protein [Streptomyces sp. SP18ES09]MEE1814237.1 hypothetical protein [Streptomyces sp. SP18ES09]